METEQVKRLQEMFPDRAKESLIQILKKYPETDERRVEKAVEDVFSSNSGPLTRQTPPSDVHLTTDEDEEPSQPPAKKLKLMTTPEVLFEKVQSLKEKFPDANPDLIYNRLEGAEDLEEAERQLSAEFDPPGALLLEPGPGPSGLQQPSPLLSEQMKSSEFVTAEEREGLMLVVDMFPAVDPYWVMKQLTQSGKSPQALINEMTDNSGYPKMKARIQQEGMESRHQELLYPDSFDPKEFLAPDWDVQDNRLVGWYFKEPSSGTWQPYMPRIASKLEHFFSSGYESAKFKTESENERLLHEVDFKSWKERSSKDGVLVQELPIKRRTASNDLPLSWEGDEDASEPVEVSDPDELLPIRNAISRTPGIQLVKVERVENPHLYRQYQIMAAQVRKETPVALEAERHLFHGTSEQNLPLINKESFNRSFVGTNVGHALGKGNYFARDFAMALRYSKLTGDGTQKVYQARVMTGCYTKGSPELLSAPLRLDGPGRFHSTVDSATDPSIFVTYLDTAAYPEYIITVR